MKAIKPAIDNFNLQKITFNADGGLSLAYDYTFEGNGKTQTVTRTETITEKPHPELSELVESLPKYIVKAVDTKKKVKDVEMVSISWAGSEGLRGVVLSGKIKSWGKSKLSISTPRIIFASDVMGGEKEVEEVVEALKLEVYEYVFNRKTATPELFSEAEEQDAKQKQMADA